MVTLYIDTHYVKLVLALFKDKKLINKKELDSAQHSKNTVFLLEQLLKEESMQIEDLNEIIVVVGPGSFTGVRIGVVIAKMIGYTKSIKIKPISYLEALSLAYDHDVFVGLKDRNGAFIGHFNAHHELIEDYFYLDNLELENYTENILFTDTINLETVVTYMENKEAVDAHLLKPLYVKKIEALK